MTTDNEDTRDVSPHASQNDRPWGAQNSLRRNARLKTKAAGDEVTPLLGDGGSPSLDERETVDEWEGANDFAGVPWWKTPSVCYILDSLNVYVY